MILRDTARAGVLRAVELGARIHGRLLIPLTRQRSAVQPERDRRNKQRRHRELAGRLTLRVTLRRDLDLPPELLDMSRQIEECSLCRRIVPITELDVLDQTTRRLLHLLEGFDDGVIDVVWDLGRGCWARSGSKSLAEQFVAQVRFRGCP